MSLSCQHYFVHSVYSWCGYPIGSCPTPNSAKRVNKWMQWWTRERDPRSQKSYWAHSKHSHMGAILIRHFCFCPTVSTTPCPCHEQTTGKNSSRRHGEDKSLGEDGLWPWSKLEMAHSNTYRGEADNKTHVGGWMSDTLEEGVYHKLELPGIL